METKRVFLADLKESHPYSNDGAQYEVINKKWGRIAGPFRVMVIGPRKIATQIVRDGRWDYLSVGDAGLAPYESGMWNDVNHTQEIIPQNKWVDDWF
jgi:hypothetical protein